MAARPLSEVSVGDVVGPVTVPVARERSSPTPTPPATRTPSTRTRRSPARSACPTSSPTACGRWAPPASVVTDWAGDAGRVVEFGTRFTKPVVVPVAGNEVVVQGVVKAVDAETGRVTVDVTTTCGGEKVLGRCVAVVRLD